MNKKMGFTLLELLTVVMIIAALTAVAVPQYRRTIQRAQAAEALMNLRTIFDAALRYKAQNSVEPPNLKGLDVNFFDASEVNPNSSVVGNFLYIFTNAAISACRLDGNETTANNTYCFTTFYNSPIYGGRGAMICQAGSKKFANVCPAFGTTRDEEPSFNSVYLLDETEE